MNKKAFTLLELLVVVVIIGILAGIALPQYRKAVGKAELAQVISATKAIQNAQERYYLIYNEYTSQLDTLDIEWPNNNVTCTIGSTSRWSACYNKNYAIVHYFSQDATGSNKIECYAKNKNLVSACESFTNKTAGLTENNACTLVAEKPCWAVWGAILPM